MRVVGYVRVSTARQAEDGLGLEVQEKALRSFCKRERFRLVGILRDEGVSGSVDAMSRAGLSEALESVRDGKADALVVPSLDRLARSLTAQEAALAHVWKHGGRVFAVDAGEVHQDDPEDPVRKAMRQMMGVFAELERGMIQARLRKGRREKAERGGYAYGAPPYGWKAHAKQLVPDESEQEAVKLARRLHRRGESLRKIALALEEAGHRPRRSERWHPEKVRSMVARRSGDS